LEKTREGERERKIERTGHRGLGGRFFILASCNARYKPNFPLSGFSSRGFSSYPKAPFMLSFFFSVIFTDCGGKFMG
jgi:hypothetical protein